MHSFVLFLFELVKTYFFLGSHDRIPFKFPARMHWTYLLCFDTSFLEKYYLARLVGLSLELPLSSVNPSLKVCRVHLGEPRGTEFRVHI